MKVSLQHIENMAQNIDVLPFDKKEFFTFSE